MASIDASLAVLNTHICTATSLVTWVILDTFVFGKPSVVGAVQGMITGLVCITPAAGRRHKAISSNFSEHFIKQVMCKNIDQNSTQESFNVGLPY